MELRDSYTAKSEDFLPAVAAAKKVGYSTDYVTRLAREEKVRGEQRGRQWFIDIDDLKLFTLRVAQEKRLRQEALREERRLEQIKNNHVHKIEQPKNNAVTSPGVLAHVQSLVVVTLMLLVMFVSFSWYEADRPIDTLLAGLESVLRDVQTAVVIQALPPEAGVPSQEYTVVPVDGKTGEVVFSDDATEIDVRRSFSDPVSVEYNNEQSGVIVPEFRSGVGASVPFVLIEDES